MGSAISGPRRRPRPLANGQPEESLTCHQPISIPIRPEPRPDLPHAAAGLAEVAAGDPHEAVACPARAASARAAAGWPPARRPARRSSRARPASRSASSSRTRSSSPRSSSRGSPGVAPAPASRPPIGKAVTNASASSRSSRAICARSERRAARSPPSTTVGRRRASAESVRRWCPVRGAPCTPPYRRRQLSHPAYHARLPPVHAVRYPTRRTSAQTHSASSTWIAGTPSTPTANSTIRCGPRT